MVGAELNDLEKNGVLDGVIERVTYCDWATPITVVRKSTGKVRIYADFKLKLIQCLNLTSILVDFQKSFSIS